MGDLEGAVEMVRGVLAEARDRNPWLRLMAVENEIDTILDALASITRERDEAVADKHNLIATQGEELVRIGLARDSEKAEAAEKIDRLTRKRDAMREGLKVAQAYALPTLNGIIESNINAEIMATAQADKELIAALVNGEGERE